MDYTDYMDLGISVNKRHKIPFLSNCEACWDGGGTKMSPATFFKLFFSVYKGFLYGYFILQSLSVQELVRPITLATFLLCIVAHVIFTAHKASFTFHRSLPGFSVLFQSKSSHLSVFSL